MKKLLWTSAMALTAAACMTACDDSSSGASNSIPEFQTEAALPDTCEMEVAKAGDTYFACFENKWIEVTDSATVEQLKEGLDEDEVKAKLEELEDLLKPATPAKPKSSSSKKTESADSKDPESSPSEEGEEECTGRHCGSDGKSSSSKKPSGGSGSGDSGSGSGEGGDSSPSSATSGSGSGDSSPSSATSGSGSGDSSPSSATSGSGSEADLEKLGTCDATLKDTVKWTGEFISGYESLPDESTSGKYFACNGTKWAEVTKLHYAFGATCEAFKNRIQQLYDKDYITDPEQYSDPFTGKAFNSDLNVLTDGNGTVLSGAGRALGRLIPEWNGLNVIYTYNGVEYTNPLCKNDEYTVAPVGVSPMRRLCTKNNVGDRGRAYKQQGSTVYGNNYWVCYEKADGTYEWGRGFVDSRTATGTVGDPKKWGDIYRMVTIGEQTWMAENLNYSPTSTTGVYCADETKGDCGTYGRLYSWTAAMGSASDGCGSEVTCDPSGNVQGICPSGWHLPSFNEFSTLVNSVTNFYDVDGFNAQNAGLYDEDGEGLEQSGTYAGFWNTRQVNTSMASRYSVGYGFAGNPKTIGNSVRCIKDAE